LITKCPKNEYLHELEKECIQESLKLSGMEHIFFMEVSNQIHSEAEFWNIYDRICIISVLGIEEEYEDKFFF
jgi:hypothetical protein